MCLLAAGGVLAGASSAGAHAALIGTNPEDGASVTTLPKQITFEFNEPIGRQSQVAVTAPDGSLIPVEDVRAVDREVTATIDGSTLRGAHIIAFRVISADGHTVSDHITVTTTEGETPSTTAPPPQERSFVHRHREHILWGVLVGVVAIGLIVAPLLRGRRA